MSAVGLRGVAALGGRTADLLCSGFGCVETLGMRRASSEVLMSSWEGCTCRLRWEGDLAGMLGVEGGDRTAAELAPGPADINQFFIPLGRWV